MIHRFTEKASREFGEAFNWEDVIIWKAGLSKAFTLLTFRPVDVRLLACELSDDITLFYHTGLFGWTGTPYAFQAVTRAIKRALQGTLQGEVHMYVDDLMGVTLRHLWEEERCGSDKSARVCSGPERWLRTSWSGGDASSKYGKNGTLEFSNLEILKF